MNKKTLLTNTFKKKKGKINYVRPIEFIRIITVPVLRMESFTREPL